MIAEAPGATPSLARCLASMFYESFLLFAVGFAAAWLFFFASGGLGAEGLPRTLLQAFIIAVYAAYFLWCWLRGGQTLAMKAWKIRLETESGARLSPRTALLRFVLALLLVPTLVGIVWSVFDRERRFLHDRLAKTRVVLVAPATSR